MLALRAQAAVRSPSPAPPRIRTFPEGSGGRSSGGQGRLCPGAPGGTWPEAGTGEAGPGSPDKIGAPSCLPSGSLADGGHGHAVGTG